MRTTLSILIVFICLSAKTQNQDYSFKKVFDVKSPAELSIITSDGDVNVQPHEAENIEIKFIAKKKGVLLDIDQEELMKYHTLEIVQTNNSLRIEAKPKVKNMPGDWKNYIVLSFDVLVPAKTTCNLQTSDGDISIKALKGQQKCKSSDGDLNLVGIMGNTDAATSDGNISVNNCKGSSNVRTSDGDIDISNIEGNINARTSDGNIEIEDIQGNIYAKSSDGHIEFLDIEGGVTGITSDGHINGEITKIDYPTELKTSDGGIRLTLPEASGFDLEMRGNNLHADFKEFRGDVSDNYINGQVNGGGETIKLTTSDGRINLRFE